jgi:PAS domain S-box-containing protein
MVSAEALNVLIVDDDEDDALFTQRMLKRATVEFRVRWVTRYPEALQALLDGGVDAAIIDYRLSGRSGIDLIAGARADGSTVPMIVLTGQGDRSVDEDAMRAGAQDYLVKSELDPSSLERAIRYAVERSHNDNLLNRMGRIMDASVNEILLFDAQEFRFVQSNTAARNNLGYNLRELSELTPFEVFDGIPRGELETLFRDLREPRRHDAMFEAANVRRDGSSYPVEVRLQYFDNERPPLFLATLMDLSERRQREDQMRRAQKMEAVGQLAGGLAHDFNNLLTVISGNLEMSQLAQNAQADLDRAEMIEEAVAAARRGAELTQRLLAFARQQPLEPTAVDAGALVANMTELLRRTLGVVIRVETMIDDGLPPVLSDAAQLENALLNLALNARDAMPDGGLLRVEVDATEQGPEAEAEGDPSPRARCVQVRVTDTGVGIGAEVLSQVFEPFFTTKRAQHGTGLGLSMVYGFVRQSGGRIGIRSQPGAGTTVTMSFPVAEGIEPAVAARAKEGAEPVCGSECILVVEDDDSVRRLAALTLSSLGYRVIQASNGDEALEALGDGRSVDLLFTDLHIPGNTGGSELVRVLRERRIVLPVLVTSGFSAGHDDEPIADVGFLPKPHSTGALARRVRAALDAHD